MLLQNSLLDAADVDADVEAAAKNAQNLVHHHLASVSALQSLALLSANAKDAAQHLVDVDADVKAAAMAMATAMAMAMATAIAMAMATATTAAMATKALRC